jgi:hypothetical protein
MFRLPASFRQPQGRMPSKQIRFLRMSLAALCLVENALS